MPDSRRLRRDRERAPLDVLLIWRRDARGDYDSNGIWQAAGETDVTLWARREDPASDTVRTLDSIGDPEREDGERVYMLRWSPSNPSVGQSLIDGAVGMTIQRIEPVARRRWLRVTCTVRDGLEGPSGPIRGAFGNAFSQAFDRDI